MGSLVPWGNSNPMAAAQQAVAAQIVDMEGTRKFYY
jgi:hypothetical protein